MYRTLSFWLASSLFLAGMGFAQQPRLVNAQVQARDAASGLDGVFRGIVNGQPGPMWVAYSVPMIPGDRSMCCYNCWNGNCSSGCSIEGSATGTMREGTVTAAPAGPAVPLEGFRDFFVFFRVEQRQVTKIRTFTPDCAIDAGGLPVFMLSGVRPADSIALLETFVKADDSSKEASREASRRFDSAISAIANHRDGAADAALDRFVASSQPESIRRKSLFWLGNARGKHGYETLTRILRDDASDKVREEAIFGLTQSKETGAMDAVIRAAHDDKSARVRGQALFWLAQRASSKISSDAIQRALETDPDTEVKKKAVFALTQMPNGEGIPKLIEVARSHSNAAVKKQAMFWLGQSKDARALRFFEDVLASR
ncbi:MAG: HEAT repeat domain-containing protein [Bryobacteraceae bacterium]